MTKAEVRKLARERVAALGSGERADKSQRICTSVLALPEVADASLVMVFISLPDEVDTEPLIDGLRAQGKGVAVPHTDVATGGLVPVALRAGASLKPASLDVPEPEHLERVEASGIDVVVIPGRAFDRSGGRVGRGKGYYDRFLSGTVPRAERIAVAYACQVFDDVPTGRDDVPVSVLVTEVEVLRFRW